MIKHLLVSLGLAKAPAPFRSYVAASSFVGVIPALAFVAWKYRANIRPLLGKLVAPRHAQAT